MRWQDIRDEYPYLYETHLHTSQGSACAKCTGAEMARAAKEYGYTGIFITDHNWGGNTAIDRALEWDQWINHYSEGYRDAKKIGDEIGLDVFWGMEAAFTGTEFLIYGMSPEQFIANPQIRNADIPELYHIVKKASGLMVHAHPYREEVYIPKIRLFPDLVDGVEGINATHTNLRSTGHKDPMYDEKAIAYANEHQLPMTAGSDIHSTALLGGGMAFKRRLESSQDFVKAVLKGEDYILTNGDNCYTRYGVLI